MNNLKQEFIEIYEKNINRTGAKELLDWIKSTDFFEAPASTRFHLCCERGLVEHSINVYQNLVKLNEIFNLTQNQETIAIISLLHDLCKIGLYKIDYRNVKNEQTQKWEKKECYKSDEDYCCGGHGSKSVFLIQEYMKLTHEEIASINCHMGVFDRPTDDYNISNAFSQFPLATLAHVADMTASFINENKK